MEKELVNKWMEKYFDGQTTLAEEQQLKNYFLHDNIAPELKPYKPLFLFFSKEQALTGNQAPCGKRRSKTQKIAVRTLLAAVAGLLLLLAISSIIHPLTGNTRYSTAYIDGKKYTDIETIRFETLSSLENLAEGNDNIYSLQIEALETMIDEHPNNR
ncbi:MAG: hypothetical protein LBC40_05860 [Dysgonamonadaceae bacterium]|jgi:hypothetical protein|nr:hypothetical protein [Dysgonamonadaceae bacterium]